MSTIAYASKPESVDIVAEVPHAFFPSDAQQYGLKESIMLYNLIFWIRLNNSAGRNRRTTAVKSNGKPILVRRTWSYNTYDAWAKIYPYWSPSQIKRIMKSLEVQGVIYTAQLNKMDRDRTKWYALVDESRLNLESLEEKKASDPTDEIVSPLPDTNNTDNNKREEEKIIQDASAPSSSTRSLKHPMGDDEESVENDYGPVEFDEADLGSPFDDLCSLPEEVDISLAVYDSVHLELFHCKFPWTQNHRKKLLIEYNRHFKSSLQDPDFIKALFIFCLTDIPIPNHQWEYSQTDFSPCVVLNEGVVNRFTRVYRIATEKTKYKRLKQFLCLTPLYEYMKRIHWRKEWDRQDEFLPRVNWTL